MADIIPFPTEGPEDTWLMTYDVMKRPDGTVYAALNGITRRELETDETVRERVLRITHILMDAAKANEAHARKIGDG